MGREHFAWVLFFFDFIPLSLFFIILIITIVVIVAVVIIILITKLFLSQNIKGFLPFSDSPSCPTEVGEWEGQGDQMAAWYSNFCLGLKHDTVLLFP